MSNHEEAFQASSAKLLDIIGQIRSLLREDLAGWPERELHKRFVATEAADALTDAQVADLKEQANALGRYFVTTVDSELSELSLWTAPLAEDQKSLRAVPAVWSTVSAIATQVDGIAERFGLVAGGPYEPPARFIGRLHLPALMDAFIREYATFHASANQVAEAARERRKAERALRWANAE